MNPSPRNRNKRKKALTRIIRATDVKNHRRPMTHHWMILPMNHPRTNRRLMSPRRKTARVNQVGKSRKMTIDRFPGLFTFLNTEADDIKFITQKERT